MPNLIRRRDLLRLGAAAGLASVAAPSWAQTIDDILAPRRAALNNTHTGESFNEVYYADGAYIPEALAEATRVMRDWRTGEECFIDPSLFDALHGIRQRLETPRPFLVISGYRSPKTNAMLRKQDHAVAEHSQHMLGKAIDIHVEGVALANLRDAALDLGAGGVGYYPRSGFVHVDTGRVRQWRGS